MQSACLRKGAGNTQLKHPEYAYLFETRPVDSGHVKGADHRFGHTDEPAQLPRQRQCPL